MLNGLPLINMNGGVVINTMLFFKVCSEKEAIQSIFNYYHLNYLTNLECSFASNSTGLNMSDTYGIMKKQMPATCDEFYNEVNRKDWDVCLCVAGTDKSDSRRVVVTYVKSLQQIIVSFPSAVNGLSKNELSIKQ